jgi:uncharacterized protein YdcH (DUF465 family)
MNDRHPDVSAVTESEEFGRLSEKHRKCDARLAELRARLFLTEEEKVEEVVLKKQKLMLKDRMEALTRMDAHGRPGGP